MHRAEPDFDKAEAAAIDVSDKIRAAFKAKFIADNQWHSIELRSCEPASESVAPFQTVRQLKKWNLDSLSLASDPQQPLVE
ncbi:hypothetical protein D3C79_1069300 [compost metagenome]